MLVLTRKQDESLVLTIPPGVSGEVRIVIVEASHNKTRLGIEADLQIGKLLQELAAAGRLLFPREAHLLQVRLGIAQVDLDLGTVMPQLVKVVFDVRQLGHSVLVAVEQRP